MSRDISPLSLMPLSVRHRQWVGASLEFVLPFFPLRSLIFYYFLSCAAATGALPGIDHEYGISPKFVCTPIPPEADPSCYSPPSVPHGASSDGHSNSHNGSNRRGMMSDEAKATILHLRESLVRQKETILDQRETIRELTAKLTLCEGFGSHHSTGHNDNHHNNHHDSHHNTHHDSHHDDHHGHHSSHHASSSPHHGPSAYHSSDHHYSHGSHRLDPHNRKGLSYSKHSSFSPEQTGKTLQTLKERLENLQARNSSSSYSSSLRELLQRKISSLEEQLHSYYRDHHDYGNHNDHHGDHRDNHHSGTSHFDDHHNDHHSNGNRDHNRDDHHGTSHRDSHHDSHHQHGSHRFNHHSSALHNDPHHYDHHSDWHHSQHHGHYGHHDSNHHGNHHNDHHNDHHGHHDDHHDYHHGPIHHEDHHDGLHDNYHHGNDHTDVHHGNDHQPRRLPLSSKETSLQGPGHSKLETVLGQLNHGNTDHGDPKKLKSPSAFMLDFPMRTNYMYARMKRSVVSEIFALTICLWLKAGAGPGLGTPFSYATPGQANELVLIEWGSNPMELLISDKMVIFDYTREIGNRGGEVCAFVVDPLAYPEMYGKAATLPITVTGGKWHHVCVTWTTRDGVWEAYQDGVKKGTGQNLSAWQPIKPGGTFILGQEQDTLGGRFDTTQSFMGELSDLQFWSRVLTPNEIHSQASCGGHLVGDIISWSQESVELHGGLTETPFDPCH